MEEGEEEIVELKVLEAAGPLLFSLIVEHRANKATNVHLLPKKGLFLKRFISCIFHKRQEFFR